MEQRLYWGDILRNARIKRNLTQKEVASILRVTRQTYSSYETGRTRPKPETIAILSNIYDIDLYDQVIKNLPADYVAEQHEFKASIPSSPERSADRHLNIRKKPEQIYPNKIDPDQ